MHIGSLLPITKDRLIVNSDGQFFVLTPQGAIFDNLSTDDLRNMSVASGVLFKDDWRFATEEEMAHWLTTPDDSRILLFIWNDARAVIRKEHEQAKQKRLSRLRLIKTDADKLT